MIRTRNVKSFAGKYDNANKMSLSKRTTELIVQLANDMRMCKEIIPEGIKGKIVR